MSSDVDRRLAMACVMGSFLGTEPPGWLLAALDGGLGGVLLFAQNIVDDEQVARLTAQLRNANPDVIIAIDEEGGDVTRLDAATGSATPCPAAFGFVDEPELTAAAYASLGERLGALGIDLTLAPCADINSNERNPIIGVRSFGRSVDVVSRHVAAAVRGFRSGGVSVCAKHFPGHGDTSDDTHLGTARTDVPLRTLEHRELPPFAAAISAGAEAVLTAHIVAPALDAAPVSLSAPWTSYLRSAMHFGGVIITDALDMEGVAQGRGTAGVADAAVRAAAAGADMLCVGSNFDQASTETVIDALVDAIEHGTLDRDNMEMSRERIATVRRHHHPVPRVDDREEAARRVARAAVVVQGPLPIGPMAVLECRPQLSMASFNVAWGIADAVSTRGWMTRSIAATDDPDDICTTFVREAGGQPLLVVVRDAGLHAWQHEVITRCRVLRPDLTVVEMGWPSPEPPTCDTYIVSHGAARASADALIEMLGAGFLESKEG